MRFPSKESVEGIRRHFPVGCRVELLRMDDVQAPPIGTKGTVTGVDDTASVMVNWDNGSDYVLRHGVGGLCTRASIATELARRDLQLCHHSDVAR